MKRWFSLICSVVVLSMVLMSVPVQASNLQNVTYYTVQPGDSLNKIARRYGVSVSSLAAANGLSWNSWVYIGQRLQIPGGSSPAPTPAPTTGSYIVQRGDTLTAIALRHGISISQLASANGISVNSWVYVGQRLTIPGQSSSPTPPSTPPATPPSTPPPTPAPTTPPPTTSGIYIVKAGNTLYSIAKWYGVTVNALKAANGLYSNIIYIGQRLIIPGSTSSPQPTPAPTPAPDPGTTYSFELGGHVRDLGMPYSDKMHYSGMNWAKTQIHYGQDPVGLVNAAHAKGFKIQLSAIGGAGMVTEAGYEQKFATWIASLATAGADAIEVWNEPNIDREWQIGLISPQAYTNLLCASYNAIKAANPGTAVISAAPAPTGWFAGCSPNGCDDQPWMEGLWNAGAANCMDYIGAHHNSGATSPSARSGHPADNGAHHHSWYFLPQTELYYNIFKGTRQLFYTEMGYASQEGVPAFSDQFGWARGTNNSQQAAWLAEAVQLSINTGKVRCIIVWNIDCTRNGTDPQDGYAIIRPGGGCPACDSLHNILGTR